MSGEVRSCDASPEPEGFPKRSTELQKYLENVFGLLVRACPRSGSPCHASFDRTPTIRCAGKLGTNPTRRRDEAQSPKRDASLQHPATRAFLPSVGHHIPPLIPRSEALLSCARHS